MSAEWIFIRDFSRIDFGEESTLLARTWHEGNLLPGYVSSNKRVCFFTHEGKTLKKQSEFEIFKGGSQILWVPKRVGQCFDAKAYQVGKTADNLPLYACRASINGTYIYGEVRGSDIHIISNDERILELQTIDLLVRN